MNGTRRMQRLLWVVLLSNLVAAAPAVAGIVAEPATRPTVEAAPVTDAVLDTALDATRNGVSGTASDAILRGVAPAFPLVTVSTEPGHAIWNKLALNRRGKWIDAFRFRVPDGEPRDMLWSFISNETRYEWYIFAVDGQPMKGFARNWYYKPQDILGERIPKGAKDLVLQTLPASCLRPGAEYVIWIKFRHGKPRPTYVAINLIPAVADPATIDAPEHIVRVLGLSRIGDPIATTAIDAMATTRPVTAL